MSFLLVFLGGGSGASVRYLINLFAEKYSVFFPFGTLFINILGSFLIAVVLAKIELFDTHKILRLLFVTGFLGGFTTFSAFSFEVFYLIDMRAYTLAFIYAFLSIALSFLACALGFMIVR